MRGEALENIVTMEEITREEAERNYVALSETVAWRNIIKRVDPKCQGPKSVGRHEC